MARMPKWPKGLKGSVSKMENKIAKKKAIDQRKREIAVLRNKKAALAKKLRGY